MKVLSKQYVRRLFLALLLLFASPALAQAHTGIGAASGCRHGLIHPITGLDHLAAMLAVGLWAAQRGGRAIWALPLAFVSVMLLGGVLGMAGVAIPLVEPAIAASVLALGLLLMPSVEWPSVASMSLVGLFALFHGHAHGTELPPTSSALVYSAGFVLTTVVLHATGVGFGLLANRAHSQQWFRYIGGALTAFGLFLCFT
jgi:urease accessory protein